MQSIVVVREGDQSCLPAATVETQCEERPTLLPFGCDGEEQADDAFRLQRWRGSLVGGRRARILRPCTSRRTGCPSCGRCHHRDHRAAMRATPVREASTRRYLKRGAMPVGWVVERSAVALCGGVREGGDSSAGSADRTVVRGQIVAHHVHFPVDIIVRVVHVERGARWALGVH